MEANKHEKSHVCFAFLGNLKNTRQQTLTECAIANTDHTPRSRSETSDLADPSPRPSHSTGSREALTGRPLCARTRRTPGGKPVGGSPRQRPLLAPSAIRYPIRLPLSSFQCDCLRDGTEAFALFRLCTRNPAERVRL